MRIPAILFLVLLSISLRAQNDTIVCDSSVTFPDNFTITANDKGKLFLPRIIGTPPEQYYLKIYGHNGEIIFFSATPSDGWNGTYNGQLLKDGDYLWYLYYRHSNETRTHGCVGVVHCVGLKYANPPAGNVLFCDTVYFPPVVFLSDCKNSSCTVVPTLFCGTDYFEMRIYDKWGELVTISYDSARGWNGLDKDGDTAEEGTYTWMITCRFQNDSPMKKYYGEFTVVHG